MSGELRRSRRLLLTVPMERPSGIYPYCDWALPLKQVVLQAVRSAWQRLVEEVERAGGTVSAESEPVITTRLEKALNQIQAEPEHPSGFSASQFQSVVRGAEMTSFDHAKLEKRPDLTFRLISVEPGIDRVLYGLFGECKIVGPNHPVKAYCEKGLSRFVCGDYAWAMPSALMIAYAHRGYTVSRDLLGYLQTSGIDGGIRFLPRPAVGLVEQLEMYESGHHRSWTYPQDGRSPGDIAVLHLWLPLPDASTPAPPGTPHSPF